MKSIAAQLCLRLLIGGGMMLGAMGVFIQWRLVRQLTAEFDGSLLEEGQALAALAEQDNGSITTDFSGESMPQFERTRGAEVFVLASSDGHELARSRSLGDTSLPLGGTSMDLPQFSHSTLPDGRSFRFVRIRFTPRNEEETEGRKPAGSSPRLEALLIVGRDEDPLSATLSELRAALLSAIAAAVVCLAATVYWSVRRGLRPLHALGREVSAVDAHSLSIRFSTRHFPSELGPIAASLDRLLERLQSAFDRERRFSANAAHEFRTPLSELRAVAEVSLAVPATESEQTQAWRDVLTATNRMESLAACLLHITRSENPIAAIERKQLLASEAISAAWRPFAGRAALRGVHISTEASCGVSIETDPSLFRAIADNLCGNAAEYAPSGSTFEVSAEQRADCVSFFFSNPPGAIVESDIPHLFEKFWRKDAALHDGAHHGMGLAIATDLTGLLGGSLVARLIPGPLLQFTLSLPLPGRLQNQINGPA